MGVESRKATLAIMNRANILQRCTVTFGREHISDYCNTLVEQQ